MSTIYYPLPIIGLRILNTIGFPKSWSWPLRSLFITDLKLKTLESNSVLHPKKKSQKFITNIGIKIWNQLVYTESYEQIFLTLAFFFFFFWKIFLTWFWGLGKVLVRILTLRSYFFHVRYSPSRLQIHPTSSFPF